MDRRRAPVLAAVSYLLVPMVGIVVLLRTLMAEEWRPHPPAFPRYEPPGKLLPSQQEYVEWASDHIAWVIQGARIRSIRFKIVALISGVSALAIPVAVAVHAPAWVSAVLGFVTATGQFVQGLSRDREQSQLAHQASVRFQKALRDFNTEVDELSGERLRDRFKEFKETFDGIKDEYGGEVFKVRGQDPPQIGEGSA